MGKRQERRQRHRKLFKVPGVADIWEGLSVAEKHFLVRMMNTTTKDGFRRLYSSPQYTMGSLALISMIKLQEVLARHRQLYTSPYEDRYPEGMINARTVSIKIDKLVNKDFRRQEREQKELRDRLCKPNYRR
jgi:hypothetical protein